MFIEKIFIYIINFILIFSTTTTHNSFTSDCGTYSGQLWEKNIVEPKQEDCYDINNIDQTSSSFCCLVSGIENLNEKTACFNLENNPTVRIKTIKEMEEIATKIKIDCGIKKSFTNDCGEANADNANQCNLNQGQTGQCCLITIESNDFNGKFCKHFNNKLDINTIGDAVVAAKTVGAKLEVNCNIKMINANLFVLLTAIIFVI